MGQIDHSVNGFFSIFHFYFAMDDRRAQLTETVNE